MANAKLKRLDFINLEAFFSAASDAQIQNTLQYSSVLFIATLTTLTPNASVYQMQTPHNFHLDLPEIRCEKLQLEPVFLSKGTEEAPQVNKSMWNIQPQRVRLN